MTHREYARTTQVPSSWSLAQGLTDASDDRPDAATPIAQPATVVRRVPLTTITTNVPTPEFPPSQSTRTSMTERERYSPTSYNVIHSRTFPIPNELRLQIYARCARTASSAQRQMAGEPSGNNRNRPPHSADLFSRPVHLSLPQSSPPSRGLGSDMPSPLPRLPPSSP